MSLRSVVSRGLRISLCLLGLCLLGLGLPAAQGQAGSWTVSYTGSGSITSPGRPTIPWGDPNLPPPGWNPDGPNAYYTVPVVNGPLTSGGTITAAFTWTGSGTSPPLSFLIFSQSYTNVLQATLNDGFGDPPATNASGYNSSQGTHLETASVSGNAASYPVSLSLSTSSGMANVGVSVTAYPIYIALAGQNAANQALTGQQITAALATPNGLPSGTKITSYTWSFSGGTKQNPIKNWDYNAPGDGTPTQLVPFASTDLSQTDTTGNGISVNSINFYDEIDKDNVTVKCTVNFTFPDGTTGSVNAVSPQVTFMKPTAIWTVNSTAPLGAQFAPTATGSMSFAVLWNASVTVPSPFSGGYGCFAQTVNPTIIFQRYPLNNQPVNCYLKVPRTNADGTITYVLPTTGLDTYFPYQASSTQLYPQGYIWDVSGAGQSGDQPGAGFATPASDNGGNNWYAAFDSDTFTTWLMYMPPSSTTGSGMTIWVPLQRVDWSWTGNVVKDAATGIWNPATNGSAVTGSSSSPGIPVDTPPQWNTVNVGTNVFRP